MLGLLSRVSGDASTAFLRKEASETIATLTDRASPLVLMAGLNDAAHSVHARSVAGRQCMVRCYTTIATRLFTNGEASTIHYKIRSVLECMIARMASFLGDGDFETR